MREQNCIERMSVMIPDDQDITVVEHLTQLNESRREVQRPTVINASKLQTIIGCWNVRTMYEIGKSAQVAREMKNYRIGILSISEIRDRSFFMGRGAGGFWGGRHPKIFELKGGAIPKVEGGKGFLQVNVLV